MKYISPSYVRENIESTDIILASAVNGTTVVEGKDASSGSVFTDLAYILGLT